MDVMSDVIGVMWDIIALIWLVELYDDINHGCGVIYSAYFAIYTVDVTS